MKQLTCEMCGSTDLLKQEGVFVCQTCGTKYSVEEAKKMMIEGTVNVSGTVKVDDTDKIENYLEMARSAYEAGNKSEAEAYCNRIIEIGPQNYEAWFMKGKAAGWQTTLANIRIEESVQCFSKAVDYAPEDKIDEFKKSAAEEVSNLSLALINLTCSNFAEYPSENNVKSMETAAVKALNCTLQLLIKCGVEPSTYINQAANNMNNAAVAAYSNCILPEYRKERYPSKYDFQTYLEKSGFCIDVFKLAIRFAEDDFDEKIISYNNLIHLNNDAMEYGGWYSTYSQYAASLVATMRKKGYRCESVGNHVYSMEIKLSDSAKSVRQKETAEYQMKIEECRRKASQKQAEEKAKQQAKNETYWAEHAEEKQQLESERNTLQAQLKQLQEQVAPYDREIAKWQKKREADTPAQEEKKTVEKQISDLRTEKDNLGIFKGKEKKALQVQIDELSSRLPTINESIEVEEKEQIKLCNDKVREIEQQAKPIKDQIAAVEKRINEIEAELTKNR